MRRSALMLSILALAAGCDKPKQNSGDDTPPPPSFDIATKPPLVFQAFGTLDSTRLVPIAAVIDGSVKPIDLPDADWRRLDSTYFQAGTEYPIYRDGQLAGTVVVSRRMWEPDSEPLYELPGCREVRPMAAVSLRTGVALDPAFEFLSLSATAGSAPTRAEAPRDLGASARAIALVALRTEGLDTADIDTASFSARAINMAGGSRATLVANQVDANAGDTGPGAGHTTHFLVLGDDVDGTGYKVTYKHLESGEARLVEFQRLLDHLDLTGDGTDEIFVESWRYASTNDLLVLTRTNGQWHESLRVPQKWCLKQR
ncbi:MAG: hypothetical protein Q8K55_04750 [Gemmatimonadaceae bacterium]|nr:hypothetical protein [Gemmatimonadaceae bacterium]